MSIVVGIWIITVLILWGIYFYAAINHLRTETIKMHVRVNELERRMSQIESQQEDRSFGN